MSFGINSNHFCSSLSDISFILFDYQLCRTEALELQPPQLIAYLSFPLYIINSKACFSIVLREQKKQQ